MCHKSDLLVWDVDDQFDGSKHDVIYWSSYTNFELDGIFSIPKLVEKNAEYLKSKYLKLIYDFGEININGKRIIDHLLIRKNFSYWWMTLLVEKCNISKSPQIDNIIKLMAFEKWLQENKYKRIELITANDELAMSMSLLAEKLIIDFSYKKIKSKQSVRMLKSFYHSMPNSVKSPIWLAYYSFSKWPLKGVGLKEWRNTTATTTFISYLFNLVPEATREGRYESMNWTRLTDLLNKSQHSSNWLHIYVKSSLLPSAKKARDFIQQLNNTKNGNQVHVTLTSFLTVPLIFKALRDWYKIFKLSNLITKQIQINCYYLWPLFKKDCQDSMSGIPVMSNILFFNLFEKAMNELPIQKKGCYLKENQGWESGFISAWQSARHKKNLIGFPHATVIYWDLRYFFDPSSYKRKSRLDLPLPDYVGVNGKIAKNMYLSGGYPKESLIEVESLRYLYLSNFSNHQAKRESGVSEGKMVLVVGDFLKENTNKQLNLLSSTIADIDPSVRFIIKPHPSCPINMEDFPGLRGELSTRPIEELMKMSNVVYSSLKTSAAIDAYCAGLPIISLLDGKTLNVSPLRGSKSVYFVSDSKSLVSAIKTAKATDSDQRKHYFYLDSGLPRWNKWLINDFNKDL